MTQTAQILSQIALALGLPLETFYGAQTDDKTGVMAAQKLELLAAFNRIDDPQMRERCLRFVEAASLAPSCDRSSTATTR